MKRKKPEPAHFERFINFRVSDTTRNFKTWPKLFISVHTRRGPFLNLRGSIEGGDLEAVTERRKA